MYDLDTYRCAWLVLIRPDPDAVLRERLDALADDPAGLTAWKRIASAVEVLRTCHSFVPGQHLQ